MMESDRDQRTHPWLNPSGEPRPDAEMDYFAKHVRDCGPCCWTDTRVDAHVRVGGRSLGRLMRYAREAPNNQGDT